MPEHIEINFKQLKSIPIEQVLDYYGVRFRRIGEQLTANCPLPTHTSSARFSFKVNWVKNVWTCKSDSCAEGYYEKLNGKRGGDILDFVAVKENVTVLQAAKLLLEWFPDGTEPKFATVAKPPKRPVNKPLTFHLKGIQYCEYLEKRGITKETANSFGVGLFTGKGSMAGRVVIPICNVGGEIVAYAGRSITDEQPKYKLPTGFHKNLVLYNFNSIGDRVDTVIVVEGYFSVFWLAQNRYPNVVALMGHSISDEQLELLNFPRVVVMLDNSEGGEEERIRTTLRIASKCFTRAITLPAGKQPDQLAPDELHDIMHNLSPAF